MAVSKVEETFFEATGIRLNNSSLLQLFNILQNSDDERYLNIWKTYKITDDASDNAVFYDLYEVEPDDWWDNISNEIYGTPYLWWIICIMNDVTNPFEELEEGDLLKVLKPSYLYQLFRELKGIAEL